MNMKALTRKLIPIATALLLTLSLLHQNLNIIEAQTPTIEINWIVYSNPTTYYDNANAVCEAGDYIYVIGDQDDDSRIEIRRKVNSSLVNAWWSQSFGSLRDCAIGEGKLYTISYPWSILVFDLEFIFDPKLFELNMRYARGSGYISSILFFDNHLYIAGEVGFSDTMFKVEKRRADNLELVKEYTSNPTTRYDKAMFIGINPVTKQLWAVGHQNCCPGGDLRIEILDLDLNPVKVIVKGGVMGYAVVFDEEGNAYVTGVKPYWGDL